MKFAFNEWNLGGKVIFISACLAVFAMFMPWIDISFYKNVSGLESGYFLLLVLFAYPVLMLLQNQLIDMKIGYGCAALSTIIALFVTSRIRQASFFDIAVVGIGAYLFILASLALGAGIYLYFNHHDGYR